MNSYYRIFLILSALTFLISSDGNSQCWDTTVTCLEHTLALKSDGTLWAWGANYTGQLGDGTSTNRVVPTQIGTDTDWQNIAIGNFQSLAIKADGTLWAWGSNDYGQLGDGTSTDRFIPTQIGTSTNWKQVSGGGLYTLAVKEDGTLWSWGYNDQRQLGDGTTDTSYLPIQIGTDTNWKQVSAGYYHSVALKVDGTLYTWGANYWGQLGNGTLNIVGVPTQIGIANDWREIFAGEGSTFGIKFNGTLWAWGHNAEGILGDGTESNILSPTIIGTDTNWKHVSAGSYHAMGTKTDGTLWVWGGNEFGTLGNGTTSSSENQLSPIQLGSETNWRFVYCGKYHCSAVKTTNSLWAWGRNNYGQLGDGTTETKSIPTLIDGDCGTICNNGSSFSETVCNPYVWNDISYATSGIYTQTFTNVDQCDSTVTLNLTINWPTSSIDTHSACESFTWIDGNTYTESNNSATYVLTNLAGCDSIVTLNLNITHPTSSIDTHSACESFTWMDGNTYTESNNSALYVLPNTAGCDSIVTLNLTINLPTSSIDSHNACESFTWIDGNTYTESNNSALYVLPNTAGCDSIVTLNLNITQIDANTSLLGETITANAAGATYQWINCNNNTPIEGETNQSFTPTVSGSYAVIVSQNGCEETSDCVNVTIINVDEISANEIVLFPNPSSGSFRIQSRERIMNVRVYDALGREIDVEYQSGNNEINGGKLASGNYNIEVILENKSVHKSVVIQ
jgi:alpha-tubulin suppressor-like RCC1 family protein